MRFSLPAATGDIDDMWLRDSSVQLAIYLPRLRRHPALRGVFEGMLRSQAFYILQVGIPGTSPFHAWILETS